MVLEPGQQCNQDRKTGHNIVVNDDKIVLKNFRRILEKDGHRVSTFNNPLRALKQLQEKYCGLR